MPSPWPTEGFSSSPNGPPLINQEDKSPGWFLALLLFKRAFINALPLDKQGFITPHPPSKDDVLPQALQLLFLLTVRQTEVPLPSFFLPEDIFDRGRPLFPSTK